jgi:Ca2+-binding EF-hand superfamily protein
VQWGGAYNRREPFVPPAGSPPQVVFKMQRASAVFREKDRDFSGQLDYNEMKNALQSLGFPPNEGEMTRLFYLIDKDRSGQISEREFCEYWGYYGW